MDAHFSLASALNNASLIPRVALAILRMVVGFLWFIVIR